MTTTELSADIDRVLLVSPRDLAIGTNARETLSQDDDAFTALVASIKERGVLEPITAYRVDGVLTVERGQRRTLAAVKAKAKLVRVLVIPAPEDRDRIVDQLAENLHRTAMTHGDVARGVEQLALLGVTEAQIVKRTALGKDAVAAALRVQKSDAAKAAAAANPGLSLDHLAGLAEFEDDEDATKELNRAIQNGGYSHTLQRMRDNRERQNARNAYAAELTAQGYTVVPAPSYGEAPGSPRRVSSLEDAVTGVRLDVAAHTSCPGHAVCVGQEWVHVWADTGELIDDDEADRLDDEDAEADEMGDVAEQPDAGPAPVVRERKQERRFCPEVVCTDPEGNGHRVVGSTRAPKMDDLTDEQKEKARQERATVKANNAAWESATRVRRDWLFGLVARKTAPAGAEVFIYRELLHSSTRIASALQSYGKGGGWQSFRDVMGLDRESSVTYGGPTQEELDELLAGADTIGPKRATLLTAAMLLCAWHHQAEKDTWRNPTQEDRRVLGQMAAWGYELSEVEQLTLAEPAAPQAPAEDGPTIVEFETTGDPERDAIAEEAALAAAEVHAVTLDGKPTTVTEDSVIVAIVDHFDLTAEQEDGIAADVDEPTADEDLDSIA